MSDRQVQYHKLDGRWHEVVVREFTESTPGLDRQWDALLQQLVSRIPRTELLSTYGVLGYALSVRPMSGSPSTAPTRGDTTPRRGGTSGR